MRPLIRNPILRGFNPDPSILRVGEDFYLATSTFEWMPGVQIHHSRDLQHWRLIGHGLNRRAQIDLRGVADSAGSWAPSLSFADGKFWLIYTNVRTAGMGRPFKDCHVYLTTAPTINGPWTDPIYIHAIGFDPSLFHDDDGKKYVVNMQWDHRKGHGRFAGIVLQEYDPIAEKLVGPIQTILQKDVLTEGPNLYKHDRYYYLMLAEGGTGWNHGISMARSRAITGPYELDPQESVLTTRHHPEHPLQKAGHGELVQTASGEWWLAHLCSRPIGPDRRCILGRETALQRVHWSEDGWLRLSNGTFLPDVEVVPPVEYLSQPWPEIAPRDDFDKTVLGPEWATLRNPADNSWLSLTARPGRLRLLGRESLHSLHEQSLVGRRMTSFSAMAETKVDFAPVRFSQMAGLLCWYDTKTHYYLRISHDEKLGKILGIILSDDSRYDELEDSQIEINSWPEVFLRANIEGAELQFSASPNGADWEKIGPILDASRLSDDYGQGLHFTGAFFALAAHDVAGMGATADFDYFELQNKDRSLDVIPNVI